ncbi:TetR-like C-terminal domain-containing protein [Streptomyces fuscichromogenes]|uniref:HTH-type transcriptional regulator MT1864/Rv1816-like C-terminal domain-containing protein n=1 Tax=Streptomyces fuscichromogenes TaxID=1324013 RepID=A0A917XIL2_9ACTN|nr:TetR-like C-terminal domain-containing protein [Streptomyces fuscichromogenes]GGN27125.1 hypothetical protein GCM10011578_062120 [Streptomyces fuscichromogenes]
MDVEGALRERLVDAGVELVLSEGTAVGHRAQARVYVTYARERRGMFELMFRHDLLDSGEQSGGPDGPRLREATLPMFQGVTELVARCRAQAPEPSAAVAAAALWANLHGIAQLWSWGSLQLALDGGSDSHDRLIEAALDAHLGPRAS